MITIGIDENNDIYIDSNNNLALKSDLDAMGDIFVNKVQTVKGELLYNNDKGIDYFNTIFGEPPYPDVFQSQVIAELSDTEDTQKVSAYDYTINNNIYSYTVDCETTYGNLKFRG